MSIDKIITKYLGDSYKTKNEGNIAFFEVKESDIVEVVKDFYFQKNLPLKTILAEDKRSSGGGFRILYVFGVPYENVFLVPFLVLKDKEKFPSVTKYIHEASIYERKIYTFFGLTPLGHPHLRPIILHSNWPENVYPLRKDFKWNARVKEGNTPYEFSKVEGEGVYEIPVGPVHAGIIEPGHFRFSVAGEEVTLLEAKLGYKHRGVEKLFEVLPLKEKLRLSERVSGDTSFTHSLAFCQAIEKLAGIEVAPYDKALRVIFSELERLANHFNDIGFIMLDTGFNFGGANCARLRERIMQWHEKLTGNRYLRGVNVFGGVSCDITLKEELINDLKNIEKDFSEIIDIQSNSTSVLNRLEGTGKMPKQIGVDHGVVGVPAKALGIPRDSRVEYPYAAYPKYKFEVVLENEGDVKARFYVRIKEVSLAIKLIGAALDDLQTAEKLNKPKDIKLKPNSFAIGIAEGWRGDIVYSVVTSDKGEVERVDVRDPSFLNWQAVGHCVKGNIVPDFPLINKSFNLSYSGNDL